MNKCKTDRNRCISGLFFVCMIYYAQQKKGRREKIIIYEEKIIPEWAKAEHMEMSVPMEELGKYGDGTNRGIRGLVDSVKEDIMRFFNKEKKQIRVIRCHSRREMESLHDKYIEKGIMAEESISVIPYSTVNVYRLLVEE